MARDSSSLSRDQGSGFGKFKLEGPHIEEWPPRGHGTLYGELKPENLGPREIENQLIKFAKLAFRRPPVDGELEPILEMVRTKLEEGLSPLQSLQLGFQTILSAHRFLYLQGRGGRSRRLCSRIEAFLFSVVLDAGWRTIRVG